MALLGRPRGGWRVVCCTRQQAALHVSAENAKSARPTVIPLRSYALISKPFLDSQNSAWNSLHLKALGLKLWADSRRAGQNNWS